MDEPTRVDDELDPDALQSLARIEAKMFGATPTPMRVDRYALQEQLGAGGMGVVYAAWDPELRRRVAIKLVQIGGVGSAGASRLMREAQAIARISHPNVIPVHDVGRYVPEATEGPRAASSVFVVMELVEGGDLERWLSRAPRRWSETLDVFLAAGRGLAAAHAAGILHRDFKPSNVLVGEDGRVRVVDFGLARPVASDATEEPASDSTPPPELAIADVHTRTGSVLGTPYYMAPEVLGGADASERSDQYSFAVALFTGLTGHGPFVRGTVEEVTRAKRAGAFVTGPDDGDVPRWLMQIVTRGLAPDPAARFASMQALLDAIDGLRHRRRNIVRSALGVGALGGAIAVGLGLGRLPEQTTEPVVAPVAVVDEVEQVHVFAFVRFEGAVAGELEWGADGLPNLMVEEIRDFADIRVVPYFRLKAQLRDESAWTSAIREQGGTVVVTGTLTRVGDALELRVVARAIDGDVLAERTVTTDERELADAARTLARDIVGAVTGRPPPDREGSTWPITYERTLQLGIAALEQFDLKSAELHLAEARKLQPDAPEAWFYAAILSEWLGRGEEAAAEFRRASAGVLGPAKRAYVDGSLLRLERGHAAALRHFESASAKHPDDIYLSYGLFEMLYHAGHGDAAVAEFRRLQTLAPRFHTGHFHVLDRIAATGDHAALATAIDAAEAAGQPAHLVGIWRARVAMLQRDPDAALAILEPLADRDGEALAIVLGLHAMRGEITLARARATQARDRGDTHVGLADLALATMMGDEKTHADAFERERSRVLRAARSDAAAISWLAIALHETLVPGADLDAVERAIEAVTPPSFHTDLRHEMTALLVGAAQNDAAAVTAARTSVFAEVRHVADALTAETAKDHAGAAEHWRGALALGLDGRFQIVQRFRLAACQRELGDHASVLATCDRVIQPPVFSWSWAATVGPCLVWSGDAAAATGDHASARGYYERVIAMRVAAKADDALVSAARTGLRALPRAPRGGRTINRSVRRHRRRSARSRSCRCTCTDR